MRLSAVSCHLTVNGPKDHPKTNLINPMSRMTAANGRAALLRFDGHDRFGLLIRPDPGRVCRPEDQYRRTPQGRGDMPRTGIVGHDQRRLSQQRDQLWNRCPAA